jgi:hypothetical protein
MPSREQTLRLAGEDGAAPNSFKGVLLEAVVPVAKEVRPGLQIVSVECYADGVVVRWLAPDGDDYSEGLSLADDVGTSYKRVAAGAFGRRALRGESLFVPAVPPKATRLGIACGGDGITVPLGREAANT